MKDSMIFSLPRDYNFIYKLIIIPNIIPSSINKSIFQSFTYSINKIIYQSNNETIIKDYYDEYKLYNHNYNIGFTTSLGEARDIQNTSLIDILRKLQINIYKYTAILPEIITFAGGYEFNIIKSNVIYL